MTTLDGRAGQPVSITTDNPAARAGDHVVSVLSKIKDCACWYAGGNSVDPRFVTVYAATVPGTSSSNFAFYQQRRAHEPTVELYAQDRGATFEVPATSFIEPTSAMDESVTAVYGGTGRPEDLAKIDAKGKLVVAEVAGRAQEEVIQAIQNAGAKLAVLIPVDPAGTSAAIDSGTSPTLPTLRGVPGPTVQRFVDLVKAGATPASFIYRPYLSQRYELGYGVEGKLTSAQVHRVKTRDLVAVRTRYHDDVSESRHGVMATPYFLGRPVGGQVAFQPLRGGQERTEYFSPGTWELDHYARELEWTTPEVLSLQAGRAYTVTWNKAVAGPAWHLTGTDPRFAGVWRDSGLLVVQPPMLSDSAGRPRTASPQPIYTGSISLYRDGQPVGNPVPSPDFALFDLPDAAAGYRLMAEANLAPGGSSLSTMVKAAWTFRSSAADNGKPVPLLMVRFDPEVNLRNSAPGNVAFTFPAYVARQGADSVSVAALSVDVSYDDGQTWQAATVTADRDHYRVGVQHPGSGYVSLRAKATDTDGNTVEQTIIRGYAIGG